MRAECEHRAREHDAGQNRESGGARAEHLRKDHYAADDHQECENRAETQHALRLPCRLPLVASCKIREILIHQLEFARAAQDIDLHGTPIPALRAQDR